MTKYCPIMSFQNDVDTISKCLEEACAWYDFEKEQCCFKTLAFATSAKPSGGSGQAYIISPSSYCQTNAVSDKIIDDSYQLTRDIPIAPTLRERSN